MVKACMCNVLDSPVSVKERDWTRGNGIRMIRRNVDVSVEALALSDQQFYFQRPSLHCVLNILLLRQSLFT
jgi:hypothetical protein